MKRRPARAPLTADRSRVMLADPGAAPPIVGPGEKLLLALYDGYPDRRTPFVARWWTCAPGGRPRPGALILRPTLEAARAVAPAGFRKRPRQKADDRRILEAWVPVREPTK